MATNNNKNSNNRLTMAEWRVTLITSAPGINKNENVGIDKQKKTHEKSLCENSISPNVCRGRYPIQRKS